MLLEFRRLDAYAFSTFEGSCFLLHADEVQRTLGASSPLPVKTHPYFLAIGQIRHVMEILIFGSMAEDGSSYEIDSDYTYYLPLTMVQELMAARLPQTRFLFRDLLFRHIYYETLQRRALQAQRLERDIDPIRMPHFPDSILAGLIKEGKISDLLGVDDIALEGPGLYSGSIHMAKPSLPQFAEGQKVYLRKREAGETPWQDSAFLEILEETPDIPEASHAQVEGPFPPTVQRGLCRAKGHKNAILLGQERLTANELARVIQEIQEGLHGIPLYAFSRNHPKATFRKERRIYHCRHCKSVELRTRYCLQDDLVEEDNRPTCSACHASMTLYEGRAVDTDLPCLECGEKVLWKETKGSEREPDESVLRAYITPEEFEVLTLEELETIRKELQILDELARQEEKAKEGD